MLLQTAKERQDKLGFQAASFIKNLAAQLKHQYKLNQKNMKYTNPGISSGDILTMSTSFFITYCISYPIMLYFGFFYHQ
jgi:hypothetical protein